MSSFLEDSKTYQYEKCAPFTREIIHHFSYWISHIKTPMWKSYRLITQSDWKLRKIHLLPINVYHGLVHLDGCFPEGKKNRISVDLLEDAQTLCSLLLHSSSIKQKQHNTQKHHQTPIDGQTTSAFMGTCSVWCI